MPNNMATGDLAIGICDRCHEKRRYLDLIPDGNLPGLRVCDPAVNPGCWDVRDPYRLPPRKPEPIALRFPRPDVSIATTPSQAGLLRVYTSVLASPFALLGHNFMTGYQTGGVEASQ